MYWFRYVGGITNNTYHLLTARRVRIVRTTFLRTLLLHPAQRKIKSMSKCNLHKVGSMFYKGGVFFYTKNIASSGPSKYNLRK